MNKKYLVIVFILIILFIVGVYVIKLNGNQKEEIKVVSQYNCPIVPNGFKMIDTPTAKWNKNENGVLEDWNKGLVIEDEIGNQFVWIPINLDGLNYPEYIKEDDRFTRMNDPLDEDGNQVLKYGGFYASRYEAGVSIEMQSVLKDIDARTNDIEGKPVSKKDVRPWNYISYKNAKNNAENMYKMQEVESKLMTKKQYQGILQWLNSSGYDLYKENHEVGNYSNVTFNFSGYYSEDYGKNYKYGREMLKAGKNMILSTGATDRNMINNIYDLAGNLMEGIEDKEFGCSCIGGYYDNIYTATTWLGEPSDKIGFRIVLKLF